MPLFKTTEDLQRSISLAGLGAELSEIAATARPTITFVGVQVPDDPLPIGTSKVGGFPDLPSDLAWACRPAYPDAERRAETIRRAGQRKREYLKSIPQLVPQLAREAVDDIPAKYEARSALLFVEPFPLAFVAQLNLEELSHEEAFDVDLPRSGLLSFFIDITTGGGQFPRVIWHDQPIASLKRTPPPHGLVEFFNTYCAASGLETSEAELWQAQATAEVLHPFSAITIPQHWEYAFPPGSLKSKAIQDWFYGEAKHTFHPKLPGNTIGGYRLGGWADNIQGNREDDLVEANTQDRISTPGETPWRHLFSVEGEHYAGTRSMIGDVIGTDGNMCYMIKHDYLVQRRFQKAQVSCQST
jgi:Domain of unknown function (DUF1963)